MSLVKSLEHLSDNAALLHRNALASLEVRLIKALRIRGEFPTSLNLLNRLQHAAPETLDSRGITRLLEVDHVLALRVLSIANYEYYRPAEPVTTIAQAVSHLSSARLPDIVANLAEAKNFNAIYLARSVSLTMMQQSIIASVIARQAVRLLDRENDLSDQAYVVCALINAAPLIMAFMKPNVYSAVCLDCLDDRILFDLIFKRLMGKSVGEMAAAVADGLSLPAIYRELALEYDRASWEIKEKPPEDKRKAHAIVTAVHVANLIAHEICYFTGIQGIQSLVRRLDMETVFSQPALEDVLGTVAENYLEHSATLGLKPLRLPEYLLWFAPVEVETAGPAWPSRLPSINERINPFLYELRQIMRGRHEEGPGDLARAVHCTLNGLVRGLNFDRAVFFKLDEGEKFLQLQLLFGMKLFEPQKMRRYLNDPQAEQMPDIQALLLRKPAFMGKPIFPDGWPFAAFPVIWRDRAVGVFYADKVRRPDGDALENQEEIACIALAEEWHDLPVDLQ